MSDYKELTKQWFIDRNLQTANPVKQFLKLGEEAGELFEGLAKNKREETIDALGDMQVVLIGMKMQLDNGNAIEASNEELELLGLMAELGTIASRIYKHVHHKETMPPYIQGPMTLVGDHINTLALMNGTSASDCLEVAYNEIKDRKGKMIDGVFVKEEDLDGK